MRARDLCSFLALLIKKGHCEVNLYSVPDTFSQRLPRNKAPEKTRKAWIPWHHSSLSAWEEASEESTQTCASTFRNVSLEPEHLHQQVESMREHI